MSRRRHDVIWMLFRIRSKNPNFLTSWTPGPMKALFTVLEKVESVEIMLYSVSVMLGGLR